MLVSGCIPATPRCTPRKRQPSFRRFLRRCVSGQGFGSRLPQAIHRIHRIHRVLRDHLSMVFSGCEGKLYVVFADGFQVRFLQAIDLCLGSCSKTVFEKVTSQTKQWLWNGPLMSLIYLMAVFNDIEYCCNALYCTLFFLNNGMQHKWQKSCTVICWHFWVGLLLFLICLKTKDRWKPDVPGPKLGPPVASWFVTPS